MTPHPQYHMVVSSPLRTFIALVPDAGTIDLLAQHARVLQGRSWARALRWIPDGNVHLTLRFLGSTEPATVDRIVRELPRVIRQEAFAYRIDRVSLFPNARRPRVLAAELADNPTLVALAAELEAYAQSLGFEPETRSFKGHLTLARARGTFPSRIDLDLEFRPIDCVARELVYFSSDTRSSGAVYTPLARVPLAEKAL